MDELYFGWLAAFGLIASAVALLPAEVRTIEVERPLSGTVRVQYSIDAGDHWLTGQVVAAGAGNTVEGAAIPLAGATQIRFRIETAP